MENTETNAIAQLAKPVENLDRGNLVAINDNYKVLDLEKYQEGRNRARGVLNTPSLEDFKSYVLDAQHGDAPVFVDHKNVSSTAVLNYSENLHAQGHCDHIAILKLEPTVVWSKLNSLKDRKLSQRDFAVFLEDWVSVLKITDADGNEITGAKALSAIRNMKINTSVNTESSVSNLSESRSRFDQVEARSKDEFTPAYFEIHDSAYLGLDERIIFLRLIINTSSDAPMFSLQIVKEENLLDEIIQEFKKKVIDLLPENPVRIGTFAA